VIEVRSYRRVFDLERRIYSVDRLRLNPGGVPVRGVVYFLVILSVELIAAGLPLVGLLAAVLPWYLRDVVLPGACATVLSAIRIEGRAFHLAAKALLRHAGGPRRLAGLRRCAAIGHRWRPAEIVLLPDGSDSRMRHLRYTGPGAVLVSAEHERHGRANEQGLIGIARPGVRSVVTLRPATERRRRPRNAPPGPDQVISVAAGARLLVRPEPSGNG
jgi:hypothetical protein